MFAGDTSMGVGAVATGATIIMPCQLADRDAVVADAIVPWWAAVTWRRRALAMLLTRSRALSQPVSCAGPQRRPSPGSPDPSARALDQLRTNYRCASQATVAGSAAPPLPSPAPPTPPRPPPPGQSPSKVARARTRRASSGPQRSRTRVSSIWP
jgi:hypothetical protein